MVMTWRHFMVLLRGLSADSELMRMHARTPAGPAQGFIDDPVESERMVAAMFGRG